MDIISYNNKLNEYYDRAYSRYLQRTPTRIFLTDFLSDIIDLMGEGKGVFIEPDTHFVMAQSSPTDSISTDSAKLDLNEWMRSTLNFSSKIGDQTIKRILESIETGNIQSEKYRSCLIIIIPFLFSQRVNGLMFSYVRMKEENNSDKKLFDMFLPFQNMMGVMFHMISCRSNNITSYSNNKTRPIFSKSSDMTINNSGNTETDDDTNIAKETDDALILNTSETMSPIYMMDDDFNYQIMIDAVNSVCDSIVITDRDLRIVFRNEPAHRFLKTHFKDTYDSNNIIDIIPQTICYMSANDNDSYYRNKRIVIDTSYPCYGDIRGCNRKTHNEKIEICANSIFSAGSLYHVMRIGSKLSEKSEQSTGKNLVAYLSHELRNPVQAITTGIYLINKTLRAICDDESNGIYESYDSHDLISNGGRYIDEQNQITREVLNISDVDSQEGTAKIISSHQYLNDRTVAICNEDTNNKTRKMRDENITGLRAVMKRVDSSCKSMKIIIDDILDLSKIDNDEMIMNMDDYEIDEILQVVADEYTPIAANKGLELICTIDSDVPETLYTDETRIYQVLTNLISNSIKYSNSGSIILSTFYDPDVNCIGFEVRDEGQGIRKSEINNLFKDFGTTTNSIPGINSNGLGLCVCQKIATLLGGSIEVKSEYHKGSTFTFVHPIDLNHSGSSSGTTDLTDSDIQDAILRDIKGDILIVDDDDNITALFKLLLKWLNYDHGAELRIDTARNEERTMALTNRKKYSLIFMDIDLDGEDGCSICEAVLSGEKNRSTPIIAITANIKSIQKDRDSRFDCFSNVLLKPFTNKDIDRVIAKYIAV